METFAEIINGFQPLIMFQSSSSQMYMRYSATPLNGIYDINNFVVNVTWQTK